MGELADVYLAAGEAFKSTGSFDRLIASMDDSVILHASTGAEPQGVEAVREALEGIRKQRGWNQQEVLAITEAEGWLAIIYRNHYDNGQTARGGGVLRFNDQGRIAEVWAHVGQPD